MQQLDTESSVWRDHVLGLLNDQIDLYASLNGLSARQAMLIENGDSDALLDVLTQRQRLIDRAQRIANDLSPYRAMWSALLGSLPSLERDVLNAKVDEAARLIDAIAQRDERDRKAMEEQRAAIAVEMRGVNHARGAVAAYSGVSTVAPGPRYQDREV